MDHSNHVRLRDDELTQDVLEVLQYTDLAMTKSVPLIMSTASAWT